MIRFACLQHWLFVLLQGWQNLISVTVFKGFKDLTLLPIIFLLLAECPMFSGRLSVVIGSSLNSSLRCGFICRMFRLDLKDLLLGGVFSLKLVTKSILVEHCFCVSVNVSDLD